MNPMHCLDVTHALRASLEMLYAESLPDFERSISSEGAHQRGGSEISEVSFEEVSWLFLFHGMRSLSAGMSDAQRS